MHIPLTTEKLRWLRLRAQRLSPRLGLAHLKTAQVVAAMTALQAQDPFAAELSLWTRSIGLTQADVEQALFIERSLVRTWCLRGTLHLLASADLGWLLPLVGPVFTAAYKGRRAALGLDDETCRRGATFLREILAGQGPLTRGMLSLRLAEHGIHLQGQALPHLLLYAALQGAICLGPGRGTGATYLLLEDWIHLGPALPREQALGRLAVRYLSAYGPASPQDLAVWSGLTLGEARAGWQAAPVELVELTYQDNPVWMLASQAAWLEDPLDPPAGVRLLPAFDTYLLGYRKRETTIAEQFWVRLNAGGGILHPLVLMDGVAIASWRLIRGAKQARLEVAPFNDLSTQAKTGIETESADLARFLGKPVIVSYM